MGVESRDSRWSSVEVAKLAVNVVIAVVGSLFTLITWREQQISQKRMEAEARFSKAAELRATVWTQASPLLNDIYSYFVYTGDFQTLNPELILEEKTKLDRLMWSNRVLFNSDGFHAYTVFIHASFDTSNRWKEPILRTVPIRGDEDKNATVQFSGEDNRSCINESYWTLQKMIAEQLDLPDPGIAPVTDPSAKQMDYGRKTSSAECEAK